MRLIEEIMNEICEVMDKFDENLERFRVINNIKNDSLFVVKKGSKIKYFI